MFERSGKVEKWKSGKVRVEKWKGGKVEKLMVGKWKGSREARRQWRMAGRGKTGQLGQLRQLRLNVAGRRVGRGAIRRLLLSGSVARAENAKREISRPPRAVQ